MEMSYLRGGCGVIRWEDEIYESVYERCGMKPCGIGMNCDVVEWVEKNTLKWFWSS